jgi:hypothetical protein
VDDEKHRVEHLMEAKAAYALRQPAPRRAGGAGRDASPLALETMLADISEEVTSDAIDRRRGQVRPAELAALFPQPIDDVEYMRPVATPTLSATFFAAITQRLNVGPPPVPGQGTSDNLGKSKMQTNNTQDCPPENPCNDAVDLGNDASEAMAKYGITRHHVENFYYGSFRYTNLDDAIAEAKRHPRAS